MNNKIKSHCRKCKRETNHLVVAQYETDGVEGKFDVQWWNSYEVLECQGCDEISFRSVHRNTDNVDYDTGDLELSISIFPNPTKGREPIPDSEGFPPLTRRIYLETLTALTNNAPILAAIGIRAIIESICKDLKTGKGNLEVKIDALAKLGHLSVGQSNMLHRHRFMGNVAAHEIQPPPPSDLIVAMEIVETLLKTIYILPAMAATLPTPKPTSQKAKVPATKVAKLAKTPIVDRVQAGGRSWPSTLSGNYLSTEIGLHADLISNGG